MKLFYVTFPDKESLKRIRSEVLEDKLAACVNSFEMDSTYLWKGEIDQGIEIAALFKTTEEKSDDLKMFIKNAHPYDVPCILEIPAEANQKYREWIIGAVD